MTNNAPKRIWFDTEFIENGETIDLLAIGMIRSDGATYYAEPLEAERDKAGDWVKTNVMPRLTGPVKPRKQIASEIIEFAGNLPEFWAYYCSYDWVALCQLFGRMIDLPKGWPMFCRDVQQVRSEMGVGELPIQENSEHNALSDAIWAMQAHQYLEARANTDALKAVKAEARAEALKGIKEKATEIMALEEGETEENLKGYARGSYFAAKCILALIPADQEGDG